MVLGVLQFELALPGAVSLKDKRRVVKSLKDRLHRELLVSVAEVAAQDNPTVAVLGASVVASEGKRAGEVLDKVLDKLHKMTEAELVANERQILHGVPDEDAWGDGIGADEPYEEEPA
ncbi:MAG: DUF503 domain-containing protein [Planctomycetota bacterium]